MFEIFSGIHNLFGIWWICGDVATWNDFHLILFIIPTAHSSWNMFYAFYNTIHVTSKGENLIRLYRKYKYIKYISISIVYCIYLSRKIHTRYWINIKNNSTKLQAHFLHKVPPIKYTPIISSIFSILSLTFSLSLLKTFIDFRLSFSNENSVFSLMFFFFIFSTHNT